jgi:hypothetical protein
MRDEIHANLTAVTHSHDLAALIDPAERTRREDRPTRQRRAGVAPAAIPLPILAATVAGLVPRWPSGAEPQSPLIFAAADVAFPQRKVTSMTAGPCGKGNTGSQGTTPVSSAGKVPACSTAAVTSTDGSGADHVVGFSVPPRSSRPESAPWLVTPRWCVRHYHRVVP